MDNYDQKVKGGCGCTNNGGECQHCNCNGQCDSCVCGCPNCPNVEDEFPVKPRGDGAKREQRRRGDSRKYRKRVGDIKRAETNMPPPGNPGRNKAQGKISTMKDRVKK